MSGPICLACPVGVARTEVVDVDLVAKAMSLEGCKRRNLKKSRRRLTKNLELKTDYAENGHGNWHASKA
jgi:hypothetical protein